MRSIRLRGPASKLLAATAFGAAGFLAVTSSFNAGGTDLRADRQIDLSGLVRAGVHDQQRLEQQASDLRDEIDELSRAAVGADDTEAQRTAAHLGGEVGLTPVTGPGVAVVLDDAPVEMRTKVDDLDTLVVHQQDIQAVANALWAGGAEAMTIQGQRVISTSAIRCVGNSVVLHGVPYPPPYRITAIGDTEELLAAVDASPGVQAYLADAKVVELGFEATVAEQLELPGFNGSIELTYAAASGP